MTVLDRHRKDFNAQDDTHVRAYLHRHFTVPEGDNPDPAASVDPERFDPQLAFILVYKFFLSNHIYQVCCLFVLSEGHDTLLLYVGLTMLASTWT